MICVKTRSKKVKAAALQVAFLLEDKRFYEVIENIHFLNTNCTGRQIANMIKEVSTTEDIIVRTYWKWSWSGEAAKFNPRYPTTIWINRRGIGRRSQGSLVKSIMHELVHVVDRIFKDFNFGHTRKRHNKRRESTPYRVGSEAEQFVKVNY
jgi:hypothetical protein